MTDKWHDQNLARLRGERLGELERKLEGAARAMASAQATIRTTKAEVLHLQRQLAAAITERATAQESLDALGAAVDKLLVAKGRFHTEQNYRALFELRREMKVPK